MRYGKEHKQATRRRIIDTAGRRFKGDGIDGSGVATLMADAGLTNGAFYGHFTSKEDLVGSAPRQLRRRLPVRRPARRDRPLHARNQTGLHRRRAGRHRRHRRPPGTRRSAVSTREDAQHLRHDGRDAAALPLPSGPTARQCGPPARPPERPRAAGRRAPKLRNRADITAEPPLRTEDDQASGAWWTGKPGGRVPIAVDDGAIAGWSAFMHRFLR